MTRRLLLRAQRGFTLVEAIIAMVIIGVISGMVAVFVGLPVQGYADGVARAELSDQADLALRRMARDLRLALPNSIRVNAVQNSLEFLLTKTGGRYLSSEDGADVTLPVLDFDDQTNTKNSFTVVGQAPAGIVPGSDYVVVYNLGDGYKPANAYALTQPQRNIALITGVAGNLLTMNENPFGAQEPAMPSPGQRFQVVSGPVTYYCEPQADGTHILTRQSGYPITVDQTDNPVPAGAGGGQRNLIAGHVASCKFEYNTMENQRNALIILTLELQPRNQAGTKVGLVQQVHVSNTP